MKRQARHGARRRRAGAAALIVGLAAGLPAQAQGVELDELDGLVGHWMELRTTLADETRDWAARRQQWQDEIDLLEQEEAALTREIEDNRRFSSGVEQNRSAALAREAEGERELKALRAVLDRAEADLRSWEPRLPPGLRDPLASGLGALPANQDEAKNLALTKRARTVAALYAQIETLQNRYHVVSETLEDGGTRRQVDVLYIGLAAGLAVSPGDDWAATGVPGEAGWDWTPDPGRAAAFRKAVRIFQRQETARLVDLPLPPLKEVAP